MHYFGPDPGQELPGGVPKRTIYNKTNHFGPDPGQELPGGFPKSIILTESETFWTKSKPGGAPRRFPKKGNL